MAATEIRRDNCRHSGGILEREIEANPCPRRSI
jgi:hypothetical protein